MIILQQYILDECR